MKTYYRIRMQANKWWAYILDDGAKELVDQHIGPSLTFEEADSAGKATGLIDIDRSKFPRGRELIQ